jgi:AcrR family transcriptional regulator
VETGTTAKGASTRRRIVHAAADLVLERGAKGTSLDDIRAVTATSKGQLFHYFPGGKSELISAIGAFQTERVLDAQRPFLDDLGTWESWEGWRDALLVHYSSQPHWGCPVGALTSELARSDPDHAADSIAHLERWRGYLRAGIARMIEARRLRNDADPEKLSLAIFAALQGGLLLTATNESIEPLRAALDLALDGLRAQAPQPGLADMRRDALRDQADTHQSDEPAGDSRAVFGEHP